jgi:hypothetical protein
MVELRWIGMFVAVHLAGCAGHRAGTPRPAESLPVQESPNRLAACTPCESREVIDSLDADWRETGGKETACGRALRYVRAVHKEARRCTKDDDCTRTDGCQATHREADTALLERWSDIALEICGKAGVMVGADSRFCDLGPPKCADGYCVLEGLSPMSK